MSLTQGKKSFCFVCICVCVRPYHNKGPLHPPLPFFRLCSRQELDSSGGRIRIMFHGRQSSHKNGSIHDPKHGRIVIFVAMIGMRPIVANVGNDQDDEDLCLGFAKGFGAFPMSEQRSHYGSFVVFLGWVVVPIVVLLNVVNVVDVLCIGCCCCHG